MPQASQPRRVATRLVLEAIRTELVRLEVLPEDAITWTSTNQVPNWLAEHRLLLRPRGFSSTRAHADGEGRTTGALRRLVDVHCRVRNELDQADQDDIKLLTEDTGYFDLEDAVVDALDIFYPEDEGGNALLAEPMRVIDAQTAESFSTHWVEAFATFEIVYLPPLDQTRQ